MTSASKEEQFFIISVVTVWFDTSKLLRLRLVSLEQPLNILVMSLTLEMSKLVRPVMLVNWGQLLNM